MAGNVATATQKLLSKVPLDSYQIPYKYLLY